MQHTDKRLFLDDVPIRRGKKVTFVDIDGKTYILTSSKNHLIELNPTARVIWKALAKPKTVNELVTITMTSFEVATEERKRVLADILRFLSTLLKYQLVKQ